MSDTYLENLHLFPEEPVETEMTEDECEFNSLAAMVDELVAAGEGEDTE